MLSINSAFQAYLNGDLDGWDLLEVVQDKGFGGFEVTKEGKLILVAAA